MFQPLMSASEIGLPKPGLPKPGLSKPGLPKPGESAAMLAGANPMSRAASAAARGLSVDMLDLPFAVDAPAGEAVVVVVGEGEHTGRDRLGLPALGDEIRAQRLRIAGLVPGATLQDDRLA